MWFALLIVVLLLSFLFLVKVIVNDFGVDNFWGQQGWRCGYPGSGDKSCAGEPTSLLVCF